jgi:DNA-binding winged helix-turn-helix (wHTH) protein/pimeloyl-ACP methyl ester carboxylesterase
LPFSFEDQLLDPIRRELSRDGQAVTVEPRVLDLLLYLVENRDRLVTKDDLIAHVWDGRVVSDSALSSAIAAARKVIGDSAQDQRLIRTSARRGFRFVGSVRPSEQPVQPDLALPLTRYARSGDVSIAYQVMGTGPIDMVLVPGIVSHVEYLHELPGYTDTLRRLSAFARIITFDCRGQGLSDRLVDAPSLDQRMDDVRAVMDAANSKRAIVFGFSAGAAMSALFAATHPERISHLILWGGLARGPRRSPEVMEQWLSDRLRNWGSGDFVKIATSARQPVSAELWERFGRLERLSTSPGAFRALNLLNNEIDVTSILGAIRAPTLILRRQTDALVRAELGRPLAELIPEAVSIEYPQGDQCFWTGDTAALLQDIERFATGRFPDGIDDDRVLATVLSASVVIPAEGAASSDERRLHQPPCWPGREIVQRHRGKLVRVAGCSLLATFDGPGRAVRCALELSSAVKEQGGALQAGLHAGEVDVRGCELGGPTIRAAILVMGQCRPGEVLVSRVVADLVAGASLNFTERGSQDESTDLPGLRVLYAAKP